MKFLSYTLFFFLFILFSCETKTKDKKKETGQLDSSFDSELKAPINPNGDSELAILMREMTIFTLKTQSGLNNMSEIPTYPSGLGRIYFAKKTDTTINLELFNGLSENYLKSVQFFYDNFKNKETNITKKEKIKLYNNMVTSCITCHSNFCGGPIKRIKKLMIAQ